MQDQGQKPQLPSTLSQLSQQNSKQKQQDGVSLKSDDKPSAQVSATQSSLQTNINSASNHSNSSIIIKDQDQQYYNDIAKEGTKQYNFKNKNKLKILIEQCKTDQPIYPCLGQLNYPMNLVGYFQGGQSKEMLGTCMFVTFNCVITSVHQLNQINHCQGKVYVKLPIDKGYCKFWSFEVNKSRYFQNKKYYQGFNIENDYAFIQVNNQDHKDQMLERTKKLRISDGYKHQDKTFDIQNGEIFGFIKEIPQGASVTEDIRVGVVLTSNGLFQYNGKFFKHNCYTIDGMSASPIFIKQLGNGEYCLVGMHVRGNYFIKQNYALLFRQTFYNQLDKFTSEARTIQQRTNIIIEIKQNLKDKLAQIKNKDISEKSKALGVIAYHLLERLNYYEQKQIYFSLNSIDYKDIIIQINKVVIEKASNCSINLFKRRKIQKEQGNFHYFCNFFEQNCSKIVEEIEQPLDLSKGHHLLLFIDECIIKNKDKIVTLKFVKQQIDKYYQVIQTIQPKKRRKNKQQTNYLNIKNEEQFIKFRQSFQIQDYIIENFELRAQRFCLLFKLFDQKLTQKSFLKIYQSIIMQAYSKIKDIRQFISIAEKKDEFQDKFMLRLQELQNIPEDINFYFDINESEQNNIKISKYKYGTKEYLEQPLSLLKLIQTYRQFYEAYFNRLNLSKQTNLINQLVKYQINFINNIYQRHLLPIIQRISLINLKEFYSSCKQKINSNINLFNKKQRSYNIIANLKQDNTPQNHNKPKQSRQKNRIHYQNFKLNKIFQTNQIQQLVYKMKPFNIDEIQYEQLKKKVVQIYYNQNGVPTLKGTGVMISPSLVFTVLHIFGKHKQNSKIFDKAKKFYEIHYNKEIYAIDKFYPKQIKATDTDDSNFKEDAFILRLDRQISYFNAKIPIMNFDQDQDQQQYKQKEQQKAQGHLSILITRRQTKYQRCIGIFQKNQRHPNHYIPLTGYESVSGAPIFMWIKNKDPFILGVYKGFMLKDHQDRNYGVYVRFNLQNFEEEISQQIQCIKSQAIQGLDEKIVDHILNQFGTVDHFLLKVLAQILRLNHYYLYLEKLQFKDIRTDVGDGILKIYFNDVNIIRKQNLKIDQNLRQKLQKQYNQRKGTQQGDFDLFKQVQVMNRNAYYQFIQQVSIIFPKRIIAESTLLSLPKDYNVPSLNIYAQQIDKYVEIVYVKSESQVNQSKSQVNQSKSQVNQSGQMKKTTVRSTDALHVPIWDKSQYFTIQQKHLIHKPKYLIQRLLTEWEIIRTNNKDKYNDEFNQLRKKFNEKNINTILQKKEETFKRIQKHFQQPNQDQDLFNNVKTSQNEDIKFMTKILKKGFNLIKQKISNKSLINSKRATYYQKIFENQIKRAKSHEVELSSKLAKLQKDQKEKFQTKYPLIAQWKIIEDINDHIQCLQYLQKIRNKKQQDNVSKN